MASLAETRTGPRPRSRFFANAAIAMAALTVASFSQSYFQPLATGSQSFSLLHHLHGLAFFAWTALYVWQANLVPAGKVKLHRELGVATVALSAALVPLGLWLAVTEIGEQLAKHSARPYEFALYNFFDLTLFALAMAAAIWLAPRRIDWHRRLVFVAAICLLGPALSRWLPWFDGVLAYPWLDTLPNLAADLFLAALALHDWRSLGRVHPATWGSALVLVPWNLLEPLVAHSASWAAFAPHLYGFA